MSLYSLWEDKSTEKQSFDALTGLRFFAAMGVVLYHFAGPIAERGPHFTSSLVGSGFIAVSFFYVLSGFVLSYSYVNREGEMRGSRKSFWAARIARIYPAYLLAFLLAAPFNILWTLRVNHFSTGIAKLLSGAVFVLTMQQAWTPWTAWYWNYPAWSVSVEAFFYFLFPFAVLGLKAFRGRTCLFGMCALWIAALIAPVSLCLMHGAAAVTRDRLQMAVEFTPLLRVPEFLIGMLLGRAYVLGFRFTPRVSKALSPCSLIAILTCLAYDSTIPRPLLANGLLVPLFAVLIYSLAEGKGLLAQMLSRPSLILLGEASYGIYILQIPVSYLLGQPPPHRSVLTLCVYLVVLVGAALLSWRFVESPLRPRIKNLLVRKNAGPVRWRVESPARVEVAALKSS